MIADADDDKVGAKTPADPIVESSRRRCDTAFPAGVVDEEAGENPGDDVGEETLVGFQIIIFWLL